MSGFKLLMVHCKNMLFYVVFTAIFMFNVLRYCGFPPLSKKTPLCMLNWLYQIARMVECGYLSCVLLVMANPKKIIPLNIYANNCLFGCSSIHS